MALTGSNPGQKEGSGATDALFLSKFGGEVYRYFSQAFPYEDKLTRQVLTEAKETKDRWAGNVNSGDHTAHSNMLADRGGVTAPNAEQLEFTEYITRLDAPRRSFDVVSDVDLLKSPSGAKDRMAYAKSQAEALAYCMGARFFSTLLQNASMPFPAVFPSTHPYNTKVIAGDSSHANLTDADAGLNVNASLTATASGSVIEEELFKYRAYFDNLGIPAEDCYVAMSPTYFQNVWKEQGQRVSATAAGVLHPTTQSMGTVPTANTAYHIGTGFTLCKTLLLPSLGTKLDSLDGAGGVSATAGNKYAPGATGGVANSGTVFGINSFTPSNSGAFEMSSGAGNPVDWNNGAIKVITLFNNVRMIAWHKRAIKMNILQGFRVSAKQHDEMLDEWLIWSALTNGFGALDPTASVYSVDVKPT